ncbi:MAG TPA: ABC transporter permease, partial [Sphingomicrobium sp.]|nr:ABC transporter permease [Sphingomicrobium sp.]
MNGLSLSRILAILSKEFTQLVRDRLTYAMIIGIPVIQLLLFGYAINSDPKHLPTAVLVQDHGKFSRSVLGALQRSDYFDLKFAARSPAEMQQMIERGTVQFAITIPGDFT